MNLSVSGIVRTVLVAAAGAGLVVAATQSQGAIALGARTADDSSVSGSTDPVRGSTVVCPGPELRGVPGVDDLPLGARVAAAAAPASVLDGVTPVTAPGSVVLTAVPGGPAKDKATSRGDLAAADVGGRAGVLAEASQSLAPGLAAAQSWLVASGDQRALASSACTQAGSDFWVLAGGGAPGRQERLVLTNPGGNPVTVDLTLHGPEGELASPQGKGIVVPARGRTSFLVDSISGDLASPALHVVAEGGVVSAAVNDSWLDGTRPAGSDDAIPTAPPSRDQVIPAVQVAGPAVLRVAVPGAAEAVVQARVLTATGPRALPTGGVTRLDGGQVRDIDLSKLPFGTVGIQVRADVPVVAAVMVSRGAPGAPSDFAWSSSTPALTGVAGLPLMDPAGSPKSLARGLGLSATGDSAVVEVVTVGAGGAEKTQRVDVARDSSATVNLTGAGSVWVRQVAGKGKVHAGVIAAISVADGTLITSTPLLDTALRTTSVSLREVRH